MVLGAAKYWQGQFIQVPPTGYVYIFDKKFCNARTRAEFSSDEYAGDNQNRDEDFYHTSREERGK